jgi:ABC-type polysaccharide/polyol phosphate transport system ATPase subunit
VNNNEVLIKAENLSKKFCLSLKRSLWYGIQDIASEVIALETNKHELRKNEFWALQNVSFEVRRGEMLGIIGQNGAGKSTILKILNGLIKPDSGQVEMCGNTQALIELKAGFSPVLSGRENIYINAAVLGISKKQIDQTLPRIVEFAGLEEFIDVPVGKYSSGMQARLGFSVVTQLNPDTLLVDEVLAVGDIAFQEKCMRRMDQLRNSDKAIIFVTHSLYQVEALCDKALWLEKGKTVQYGKAADVIRAYLDNQERKSMQEASKEKLTYQGRITEATKAYFRTREEEKSRSALPGLDNNSDLIKITRVELIDASGNSANEFPFRSDLTVRIHYYATKRIERPLFNLRFLNKGRGIFEASMLIDGYGPDWVEGAGTVECCLSGLPLTPKTYEIVLFVRSSEGITNLTTMRIVAWFRVTDEQLDKVPLHGPMALNHLRQGSPVYLPRTWRFYNGNELTHTVESKYNEHK